MEPTTTTYGGVGGDSPPFWPPSTTRSRRRNPPSPFLNPAFVILPLIFFLLTLFLVPTFFSRNSQISKPSITNNTKGSSVKKTWDLFNVLLVLFAVLCGIFAKKTANDDYMTSSTTNSTATGARDDVRNMNLMKSGEQFGDVSSSNQWLDSNGDDHHHHHHHRLFSDTRVPESNRDVVFNQLRTMNDGSAFSDLRHEQVIPMNGPAGKYGSDERFKFFDDFDINRYRTFEMNDNVVPVHRRRRSMGELSEFKPVSVDKFVVADSTEVNPPPLESVGDGVTVMETVPPPSPPVRKPRKNTHHPSVSRMVDVQKRARSPPPPATSMQGPPPTSLPPPEVVTLPPPEVEDAVLEKKKKSANATKEIKTVLASIYNPVKRKKKNKTKVIIDDSLRSKPDIPVDSSPPSMQPPPLPPPPPPSVFKLFKKSSKNKKIHSVPPPAPPPPRRHHRQNTPLPPPISQPQPELQSQPKPPQRAGPSQRRTHSTSTTGRPPLPNKINSFSYNADNESLSNNSGSQSPLVPMPPPPVPPFQMAAMKFTVKGDHIRITSGSSTRCSSPELDSSSKESPWSSNVTDGGDVIAQTSSVFCPSPDVNMKADTFIARLRDEWRNDKINSMKGKQKLGRVPGSNSIN